MNPRLIKRVGKIQIFEGKVSHEALSQHPKFCCQILSRFFLIWLLPSMIDDEDNLFPKSFSKGFMGQLVA
jgi:hypothetical protein